MLLTSLSAFLGLLLVYRGLHATSVTTVGSGGFLYATLVNVPAVCQEIASSVSSASSVFFPGTQQYAADISHFANSSSQDAACSFEPGTPDDVATALQILGKARCPFAVKSGGHAGNQGFSSTLGVQIALSRLSNVTYDNATQTAKVGAGLVWDDVYAALEPYGVGVAGGRVSGIGVGGFTLGGGYSWHANQYGLTIDMVEAFEVVLPNGTITIVEASKADLFFALKGGFNNFGIVTQFTFKTFPQTQVWGGSISYNASQVDQFTRATANFAANNTDPRANILASYVYAQRGATVGQVNSVILFYDGPSPPNGLFDDFLTNETSTEVFTRSFLSLVQSSSAPAAAGLRTAFDTVSVLDYPKDLLQYISNETVYWGTTLPLDDGYVSITAEPFLPNIYSHNTTPTAWPGSRAFFSPSSFSFGWTGNGSSDNVMINGIKQSAANVRSKVVTKKERSLYANYAIAGTPLEAMYGGHIGRLRSIAKEVDPENVMKLTGGFKF